MQHVSGQLPRATNNVVVEVESVNSIKVGNKKLGRVLLTHLHSYATPFIRYDVGDLASLSGSLPMRTGRTDVIERLRKKKRLLKLQLSKYRNSRRFLESRPGTNLRL
jgi:phenylacetate-coenzyme A ligase PaaK-like adenylate-forming protein